MSLLIIQLIQNVKLEFGIPKYNKFIVARISFKKIRLSKIGLRVVWAVNVANIYTAKRVAFMR
jgi:hypothetical protein